MRLICSSLQIKPNWLNFTSLRLSSPILASKATSKRTSKRWSCVSFRVRFSRDFSWLPHTLCYSSLATRKRTTERWSCVSFRVRFSRDFSWLPHTLCYSSLATRKRTSERWSYLPCEVFAWLLRDSPIHLVTVRCPLRPARDLKTISNH